MEDSDAYLTIEDLPLNVSSLRTNIVSSNVKSQPVGATSSNVECVEIHCDSPDSDLVQPRDNSRSVELPKVFDISHNFGSELTSDTSLDVLNIPIYDITSNVSSLQMCDVISTVPSAQMYDVVSTVPSAQTPDITKCSICLETFKEPKVLPCIHTFCLKCLDSLCKDSNSEKQASCPLCRKVFLVPLAGVQDIPDNVFMNQLLQVNQSDDATGKSSKQKLLPCCELCSDVDVEATATFFCIDCQQHICDRCSAIHKKQKVTKSHQVINVQDASSLEMGMKMTLNYCSEHPDKQEELHCYDCKLNLCVMCYVARHNKHECSDIKIAYEKFTQQLTDDIKNVSDCILQSCNIKKEIEAKNQIFLDKCEASHVEISKLIEELNAFKNQSLKKFECKKDEVERQIVIMESFTRYCQEMILKGTVCLVSHSAYDLHARAEELVKTDSQRIRPNPYETDLSFSSSFADKASDKNFIGALISSGMVIEEKEISKFCKIRNLEPVENLESNARLLLDTKPQLICAIPNTGSISGITVLGNEVFVVQGKTWRGVDVYDWTFFTHKRFLPIPISKKLNLIISTGGNLYMSFTEEKRLLRFDYANNTYSYVSIGGVCSGLSKTASGSILVTLQDSKEVEERSSWNGNLIQRISLDSTMNLQHCIKISDNYYIIIDENRTCDKVCILDTVWRTIYAYHGSTRKPTYFFEQLMSRHLVLDKKGNVLVANVNNSNKIELLSPTLRKLGDIEVPGYMLNIPCVLHLDGNRLYIGEQDGGMLYVLTTY